MASPEGQGNEAWKTENKISLVLAITQQEGTLTLSFNCYYLSLFNPLNAELNPICHFLALLGAHHILHVSRLSVKYPFVYPSFAVTGTVRI